MRYFIDANTLNDSMNYTFLSVDYTHDHKGWETQQIKHKRILAGQICQNYLYYWMNLNGIPACKDTSTHEQNDFFDLVIQGTLLDVKSSLNPKMPMCITKPYERKKIDFFVFFKVGYTFQWWIEPQGYIDYHTCMNKRYFIPHKGIIPGTDLKCTFEDGAYFYPGPFMDFNNLFDLSLIRQPALYKLP